MEKNKILLAAAEAVPFAQVGDLGVITGALARSLHKIGADVRCILPLYRGIREKYRTKLTKCAQLVIPTHDGDVKSTLYRIKNEGILFYFIEADQYFNRPYLYEEMDENGGWSDYPDNLERFSFFSRSIMEALKAIAFAPTVIHTFSWHTALVPALLKIYYRKDPLFRETRTLFTIPNAAFQGLFPGTLFPRTTLPAHFFSTEFYEYYGMINLLKGGVLFSDWITTISKRYARDIQTERHGHGLDGVFRDRAATLTGISNGLDYREWDPEKDPHTWKIRFNRDKLERKTTIKTRLLVEAGIPPERHQLPLFIFISRMDAQKGMGLIDEIKDRLLQLDINLLFCAEGSRRYVEMFQRMAEMSRERVLLLAGPPDTPRLHQLLAAADVLLMPAEFEPGGIHQLAALRYGTLPLVHDTGGLADTVTDGQDGFVFYQYKPEALLETVRRAVALYADREAWTAMQKHAMDKDVSWARTGREYMNIYEALRQAGLNAQQEA
jgi:starch synthase